MTMKEYENNHTVTLASEPAVAYVGRTTKSPRSDSMTVDDYFDKVRKALDKQACQTLNSQIEDLLR